MLSKPRTVTHLAFIITISLSLAGISYARPKAPAKSPKLYASASKGTHFRKATVELSRKKTEPKISEIVVTKSMDKASTKVVTAKKGKPTPSETPTENISFNYSKPVVTYKPQKKDGDMVITKHIDKSSPVLFMDKPAGGKKAGANLMGNVKGESQEDQHKDW